MRSRSLKLSFPLDLVLTCAPLRRGAGDPTMRFSRGEMWRAARTPDGPGTLHALVRGPLLEARAWGPGAGWMLETLPQLVGHDDDARGFVGRHQVVSELSRRFTGLRIGRSLCVIESLVPAILEQKVLGSQARDAFRRIVYQFGEPAPGPAAKLFVPPEPQTLVSQPYWVFHRFGVERKRAEVIKAACSYAKRLEEAVSLPRTEAYARLTAIRGIGPWTAAEVALRAFGDSDAVSVGDFHLPHLVSWALAGEPRGDDQRMLELLEPYRGHRARAIRLLEVGAHRPPKFGPRMAKHSIHKL